MSWRIGLACAFSLAFSFSAFLLHVHLTFAFSAFFLHLHLTFPFAFSAFLVHLPFLFPLAFLSGHQQFAQGLVGNFLDGAVEACRLGRRALHQAKGNQKKPGPDADTNGTHTNPPCQ